MSHLVPKPDTPYTCCNNVIKGWGQVVVMKWHRDRCAQTTVWLIQQVNIVYIRTTVISNCSNTSGPRAKRTEIWSEKAPDLSHLGAIRPTLEPNLPSLVDTITTILLTKFYDFFIGAMEKLICSLFLLSNNTTHSRRDTRPDADKSTDKDKACLVQQ